MKTKSSKILAAASLFAAAAVAIPPAIAAPPTSFDGLWRVSVEVHSGQCKHQRAVPIEVTTGNVRYAGAFGSAVARGAVGAGGRVNLQFAYRGNVLEAVGALDGNSGSGKWISSPHDCRGSWTATRS